MPAASSVAESAPAAADGIKRIKTVCPFCAVGCSIWAEVENGTWIGQEPAFESPVNMATHCAKGGATRELAIGERRLKYPTKLEGGRWKRISWDQARRLRKVGKPVPVTFFLSLSGPILSLSASSRLWR